MKPGLAVICAIILSACSGTDAPDQPPKKTIETCDLVPQIGQVFHWDVNELMNGEKNHTTETDEVLARHGLVTLRLWTRNSNNGGVEVMNQLFYGPVYIGDLGDFVAIDMVVDKPLLKQEVPDIDQVLATIERDIKTGQTSDLIDSVDAALKTRSPDTEIEYDFIRYAEVIRWHEESEIIGYINTDTPTDLLVLDRIRTLGAEGEDTRSFWFTKDGCQMVRYTTSYIIPESRNTAQSDLTRIEP